MDKIVSNRASAAIQFERTKVKACGSLEWVPQGSVLGPMLYVLHINDIVDNVQSKILLFADDINLYREIATQEDAGGLQRDLDRIVNQSKFWMVALSMAKCKKLIIPLVRDMI